MLAVLIHPVWRHHHIEDIIDQVHFEDAIHFSSGGKGGAGVDFDEPGLEVLIDEDIESVALKAMLVVDNDTLHALQTHKDYVIDFIKAFVSYYFATRLFEIEPQVLNAPFGSVSLVVVVRVLLNCHIRQMYKHVIQLSYIWSVFFIAKPGKAH